MMAWRVSGVKPKLHLFSICCEFVVHNKSDKCMEFELNRPTELRITMWSSKL